MKKGWNVTAIMMLAAVAAALWGCLEASPRPGPKPAEQVSAPVISPETGTWATPVEVDIWEPTPGAAVHYTLNGETPTSASTLFTGPFTLSQSTTVRAVAILDGMDDSPVTESALTLIPGVIMTTTSLPAGQDGVAYSHALQAEGTGTPFSWFTRPVGIFFFPNTFSTTGTAQGWKGAQESGWDLALPFSFPIGGSAYTCCRVNADGVLGFGPGGEMGYTAKVMVLRNTMDTLDGDIFVDASTGSVTVRWQGTYRSDSKAASRNSEADDVNISVTLFPDGRILMKYGDGNVHGGTIAVFTPDGPFVSGRSNAGSQSQAEDLLFQPSALPPGLSLSADGVLSGIPGAAGTFSVFIGVYDSIGGADFRLFPLIIEPNANILPDPVVEPPAGEYFSQVSVQATSSASGATLRYTTDGSDPTESSSVYAGPVVLTLPEGSGPSRVCYKVRAFQEGFTPSHVITSCYDLLPPTQLPTPHIQPNGGTFFGSVTVRISFSGGEGKASGSLQGALDPAEIRYTLDGSDPTPQSALYTTPFTLTEPTTVKARAYLPPCPESAVATAVFDVKAAVVIATDTLPPAVQFEPYTAMLEASSGTPPYTWSSGRSYLESSAPNSFAEQGVSQGWSGSTGYCYEYELPFPFLFYGEWFTRCWVSVDGAVRFDHGGSIGGLAGAKAIAALYDSLDTRGVYVASGPDSVTFRWSGYYRWSSDPFNMSLTLFRDGGVRMRFGSGNVQGGAIGLFSGDGRTLLYSTHSGYSDLGNAEDILFTPQGLLPEGLDLSTGGVVSGSPLVSGAFVVKVSVRDTAGSTAVKDLPLTVDPKVARPVITPPGGPVTPEDRVTLSTATPGATIRYTVDGTEPTAQSEIYATPIALTQNTVIKAKGFLDGAHDSETAEASFTFIPVGGTLIHEGPLEHDTTWHAGYVHRMTGDVTVPVGVTLTLAPGTEIRVVAGADSTASGNDPGRCELIVRGRLVAPGTAAQPVRFVSEALTPDRGDWYGIRSEGTFDGAMQPLALDYCEVRHAVRGISLDTAYDRTLSLHDCAVSYTLEQGIYAYARSGAKVIADLQGNQVLYAQGSGIELSAQGCALAGGQYVYSSIQGTLSGNTANFNNQNGIAVSSYYSDQSRVDVTLSGNTVEGSGIDGYNGISVYGRGTLRATGNTLSGNGNAGLYLSGPSGLTWNAVIARNQVMNNAGAGIQADCGNGGTLSVSANEVSGNQEGILLNGTPTLPATLSATLNRVSGNGSTGVNVYSGRPADVLFNEVHENLWDGVYLYAGSGTAVRFNSLWGNAEWAFDLVDGNAGAVDAQGCWWGASTTAEMAAGGNPRNIARIQDNFDNAYRGVVDYSAWAMEAIVLPAAAKSVIVTPLPGEVRKAATVHLSGFSVAPDGVARVTVSLDGGLTWLTAEGTTRWALDWEAPADGAYTALVKSVDLLEQEETTPSSVTFTVNRSVPVTTSGTLTADESWTGDMTLTGDVTVPAGITLTLSPGAHVKALAGSDDQGGGEDPSRIELIVRGVLQVEGTPAEPVSFDSASANPVKGDWYGIRADGQGSLTVAHAIIARAVHGLHVEAAGALSLSVADSVVQQCSGTGIRVGATSGGPVSVNVTGTQVTDNGQDPGSADGIRLEGEIAGTLTGNTFSRNPGRGLYARGTGAGLSLLADGNTAGDNQTAGFYFEGTMASGGLRVSHNTASGNGAAGFDTRVVNGSGGPIGILDNQSFSNHGNGFTAEGGSSARFLRNEAHHNDGAGLSLSYMSEPEVVGNALHDNQGWGLACITSGSPAAVLYNTVQANAGGGVKISGETGTVVRHCTLAGNGSTDLSNEGYRPMDARANAWDAATAAEMAAGGNPKNIAPILDAYDDPSKGVADYSGWVSTPAVLPALPVSEITRPGENLVLHASRLRLRGVAWAPEGVSRVEVSLDGGATWSIAEGKPVWHYDWTVNGTGTFVLLSRVVDALGAVETPGPGVTVTLDGGLPTTCGELAANETWSGDVTLRGDVTVPDGVTLTLSPGTRVNVLPSADWTESGSDPATTDLLVAGNLSAAGTEVSPILFTSASTGTGVPLAGEWGGLCLRPAAPGALSLFRCTVEYAKIGVDLETSRETTLSMSGCTLRFNRTDGARLVNTGASPLALDLEGNTVSGNGGNGITTSAGIVSGNPAWRFALNTVTGNGAAGIDASTGSAVATFFRNTVTGQGAEGITLFSSSEPPEVAWNTVRQNARAGIALNFTGPAGKTAVVHHNTVTHNASANWWDVDHQGGAGISLYGSGSTAVRFNNLWDNGAHYDLNNSGPAGVDARFNAWGPANTAEMAAGGNPKNLSRVWDVFDRDTRGAVDYNEWFAAALPLGEAPLCRVTSPAEGTEMPLGETLHLAGLAMAPQGVDAVEVSADDGATWTATSPVFTGIPDLWQWEWTPAVAGTFTLRSRVIIAGIPLETPGGTLAVTVTQTDTTPPVPPTVNPPATPTNMSPCSLSGAKETGASIRINGTETVPVGPETAWACAWPLTEGSNNMQVLSMDAAGNASDPVAVTVVYDVTPPHAVTELVASDRGDGTSVTLDWSGYDAVLDGDVALYRVYARDAVFASLEGLTPAMTLPVGTTHTDVTGLTKGQPWFFAVAAQDWAGNFRTAVTPVSATPRDTRAPEEAVNVRLQSGPDRLSLAWDPSPNTAGDLVMYRVYVDAQVPGTDVPAAQMTFEQAGLAPATSHAFRVTAVDADGNESAGIGATGWTFLHNPAGLNAATASRRVTLAWQPVQPSAALAHYAAYRNETPFTSVAGMTPFALVTECQATADELIDGRAYYFAVTAVNVTGGEDKAVTTVTATPSAGPAFTGVFWDGAPLADGAVLSQPGTVSATFEKMEETARVTFSLDGTTLGIDADRTDGFSVSVNLNLIADGPHALTLAAEDIYGKSVPLTRAVTVTLAAPLLPPVITTPVDGAAVDTRDIPLTGTGIYGTEVEVYLNGTTQGSPIAVGPDGAFGGTLTLADGENTLQAAARNRAGVGPLGPVPALRISCLANPPAAPDVLRATAREAGAIRLTWVPAGAQDLSGFNVYRAAQPFTTFPEAVKVNASPVAGTVFEDTPAQEETWYYRVTAINRAGLEGNPSEMASAVSDRTPPRALSLEYTPGPGTPFQGGRFGVGRVDVRLTVSEPLLTTPFLGIVPNQGAALAVILQKESDTVYTGSFQVIQYTPSGTAHAVLSARDTAGNRGTAVDAGATVELDTEGPALTALVLTPAAPIPNDPAAPVTVQLALTLSEAPAAGTVPDLYYTLSAVSQTPQRLDLAPIAGGWEGALTLPADAGADGGEWLVFTFHAVDDLGNAGTRIAGRSAFEVYQGELPALAAPVITGKALPGGNLSLAWNPVFGASDYEVFISAAPGDGVTPPAEPGVSLGRTSGATAFTHKPALDGHYKLAVRSVRVANGQEALSDLGNVVELLSDSVAPQAAANLRLTLVGQGIKAEWDASPSALAGESVTYALYRAEAEILSLDGLTPVADKLAALEAVDAAPGPGGHYYTVVATDAVGNVSPLAPCAYLNPGLLPVASLAVSRTVGETPLLTWTHPATGLAGFNVYAGEPGGLTLLNAAPVTAPPFTDATYHEGARLYTVTAVDAAWQESPGRSLRLPAVRLALPAGLVIRRGTLQTVDVAVTNLDSRPLEGAVLNLDLKGRTHVSDPFGLAGGEAKTVPLVVGGYRDLAGNEPVRTELAVTPGANERASLALNGLLQAADPSENPYGLTLNTGTMLRGGNAAVGFTFTNATGVEVELRTARQNGAQPSAELRFELVSSRDGVIASAPVHQFLGQGVTLLPDGAAVARVAPGASFTSASGSLHVPSGAAGDLTLRLTLDAIHYRTGTPEHVAVEGFARSMPVTLQEAPYRGEVTGVTPESSDGSVPVVITGRALDGGGNPVPSSPLKLVVSNQGFDRSTDLTTGADGSFSTTFTPNRGEGGLYETWANHPAVTERAAQRSFVIRYVRITPSALDARFPRNYPARFTLTLQASPGTPAENLRLAPDGSLPAGVRLIETDTVNLAAGAAGTLSFVLGADNTAPETGDLTLALVGAAPANETWGRLAVHFTLSASATGAKVTPSPLQAGVARGGSVVTTAVLENIGIQALEGTRLRLLDLEGNPVPSWLGLNGSGPDGVLQLGRVAVGEKRPFSFTAAPGADVPLSGTSPYAFMLHVDGDNAVPSQVPVFVYVGESGSGSLLLKATDLFYGVSNSGVEGARVTLTREDGFTPALEATTDAGGEALLSDLPAGDYKYRVNAAHHDTAIGWVRVNPGVTTPVQVPLNYQLVSVEWEVRPIVIGDLYEIVLHATFQTSIPAPTLDVEPASVTLDPAMQPGQVLSGEVQVTNNGLITASGIRFTLPAADPRYRVEYLAVPPDTLHPHEFFRMPYRVTKLTGTPPGADPCHIFSAIGVFSFSYLGGDQQVYTGSSPVCWAENFPAACLDSSGGGGLIDLNLPEGNNNGLPGAEVNEPGQPLCDSGAACTATVRLQIAQELSLERQAFDARMKISNGAAGMNVGNVRVEVLFKDAQGNPVTATNDPNDTTAAFFLRADSDTVTGFTDGAWTAVDVPAGTSSEMHWLIVPAPGAGGTAPTGKLYTVGARLSYTLGGEANQREILPDSITVLPMPELRLDYFLPTDVSGDDPMTADVVEPEAPFPLGLLLRNTGYGMAKALKIESAQPKIVSNDQGLLVKFTIEGTEVNGAAATPSLAADFGDVAPQGNAVARWIMTSSLCGRFVSFEATYTHDDGLGGTLTSLIKEVKTHGLLKDVRVDLPGRDTLRDFLGYERAGNGDPVDGTLAVYESQGTVTPVSDQSAGAVLEPVEGAPGRYTLRRDPAAQDPGFVTVATADPFAGTKVLQSVTRSDGKVVDPDNAWLHRKWVSGGNWVYTLHVFDFDSAGLTYDVVFADAVTGNRAPVLAYIGPRSVSVGSQLGLQVLASDPDGTVPVITTSALPDGAAFTVTSTNPEAGSAVGEFFWSPTAAQQGEYWVTFTAADADGLTDSETVHVTVGDGTAPVQSPVLYEPADGLCVASSPLTISGMSREGDAVVLYANGQRRGDPAPVDRVTRNFRGALPLTVGINTVEAASAGCFGEGPKCAPVTVVYDPAGAVAPVNVTAESREAGVVRLTFSTGIQPNIEKILVYRAAQPFTAAAEASVAAELAADAYSYDDLPPADGAWYYRLRVVKRNGLESGLSQQVTAVSDRVPPAATSLTLTPRGPVVGNRVGPGPVDVALAVSEPLLATPFMSFAPAGGTAIPIALRAGEGNTYTGAFQVTSRTPSGLGHIVLSMRDMVGNRGTEVPPDATLLLDTAGPVVKVLSVAPPSPICNDTAVTLSIDLTFDEAFTGENVPYLDYVLSSTHPYPTAVALTKVSDLQWSGSFTLPADAGSTPETLSFSYRGVDDLGNVSTRIDGRKSFDVYQGALPPLSAPTGLRAVSAPGGRIVLSWNGVTGSADYRVYRADGEGPLALLASSGGSTGYTDEPGVDGTYRYAVSSLRVENGTPAESALSAEAQGVADSVPPNAPSNLRLTLTGNGVKAQWDAPVPFTETVTYSLYRGGEEITDVAGLTPVASEIAVLTVVDPAPTHDTPFYAVVAVDAAGNVSAPSPSAFLNADLLPVSGLTLERTDNGFPVLTWTAAAAPSIVGYNVYAGPEGREVRLNGLVLTDKTFTDDTWDGAVRRYAVAAVDEYGRESLRRAVTLPLLDVGVTAVPTLARGEMNPVTVGVAGLCELNLAEVRAGIRLAGKDHVSPKFALAPNGSKPDAVVVVGGYRDLPDSAAFSAYAEVIPSPGDRVVIRKTGGVFPVTDGVGSYTVDILQDPIVAGGGGGVRFRLVNHTPASVDLVTATNAGAVPSTEVRMRLLDADGVELSRASLKQTTGGGVYNLAGGTTIARIGSPEESAAGGDADTWTSDPVFLTAPLNAKAPLSVMLDIDQVHYRVGEREHVAIQGFSVTKGDIALADPPYTGAVTSVTPSDSFGTEPVLISGTVTDKATGEPKPEADLVLLLVTDGFVRRIDKLKSDAAGNFTFAFQPLPKEGGLYTVAAVHPVVREAPPQASFTVRRLIVEPKAVQARVPRNYAGPMTFRLTALAGTTASCVKVVPTEALPSGVSLLVGDPGVPLESQGCELSVTGPSTVDLKITLVGDNTAAATGHVALRVVSNETGPKAWGAIDLGYELVDAAPALKATPTHVTTGVNPGGSTSEIIQVKNVGFAPLENATVSLTASDGSAAPDWIILGNVSAPAGGGSMAPRDKASVPLSSDVNYRRRVQALNQSGIIPLINVNEKKDISLTFAPAETVPPRPDPYNLVLRVASADGTVTLDVPVVVYVDATGKGNLLVQAYDLYSGSGVSRPAGSLGPKITLKKVDGAPIPDVVSQADADWSDVLVRDLPVGLWDYRVSADRHEAVAGRVEIKPGVTATLETLLRNTLVTVEWEVVPTTIQDQYQVVLTADYETQVPAPVVTVTPTSVALPYLNAGENYTGEFLVENQGLVRADNVTLVVPDGGTTYRFEFLSQPPDSLEPNQYVRLPYRVTRLSVETKSSSSPSGRGKRFSATSDDCTACDVYPGGVGYDVICPNGSKFVSGGPLYFGNCHVVPCPPGGGPGEGTPVNFNYPAGEAGWGGAPISQGGSKGRNCESSNLPGGPDIDPCQGRPPLNCKMQIISPLSNNQNPEKILLVAKEKDPSVFIQAYALVDYVSELCDYNWRLERGGTVVAIFNGILFSHSFWEPGEYTLTLTVTQEIGGNACQTECKTLKIYVIKIGYFRFTELFANNNSQTTKPRYEYYVQTGDIAEHPLISIKIKKGKTEIATAMAETPKLIDANEWDAKNILPDRYKAVLTISGLTDSPEEIDQSDFYMIKLELSVIGIKLVPAPNLSDKREIDVIVPRNAEGVLNAYLHFNLDADNTTNVSDFTISNICPNEDDLKSIKISLIPDLTIGDITIKRDTNKLSIWKDRYKGETKKLLSVSDSVNEKKWHLPSISEHADFFAVKDNLWAEGCDDGNAKLTVEFSDSNGRVIAADCLNYQFIGIQEGNLPTWSLQQQAANRYPKIVNCEWSVTAGDSLLYNCKAWVVGLTDRWAQCGGIPYKNIREWTQTINGVTRTYLNVDTFGNTNKTNNGQDDPEDYDAFFLSYGYIQCNELEAEIMLYHKPNGEIVHAAKKTNISCGDPQWVMFESKLGPSIRIVHEKYQLNSEGYGEPFRYYKRQ
ncbi:MAG: chitobiase/beta-hexosaminidase C-terminal domain-containing protein [Acidobacteria bacterium]|nr:chitobiase/beta-hexosaminidase C-terminal domain-containing protein [Acidobacteriota bacterium]